MKILNKKIAKNCYCTEAHLKSCGWVQKVIQGDYAVWEQAQEELYYQISSQLIIGVYQKGGKDDSKTK